MDLLEEFQSRAEALSSEGVYEGIQAAITHIQAAERYLFRAREENDEDLLNDVIYRTNQAFEGMLKEAYAVLTGRDSPRVTPHTVEQHLLEENVFTPRVMELFTNYRQEWRNPSTHNHRLVFRDQEALLAIVSVTAFATILLDQIIQAVNLKREKDEIEGKEQEIKSKIFSYNTLPFQDQLLSLLESFSNQLQHSEEPLITDLEAEVSGRLSGFISSIDPDIRILHQHPIPGSYDLLPDLLLVKNDEEVPVELKRPGLTERGLSRARDQVLSYVEAGNYAFGVLYVPPSFPDQEITTSEVNAQAGERTVPIYTVAPEVTPQAFSVKVEDHEGTPVAGAQILSVAANGTYQEVRTDPYGAGKLAVPKRMLLTIYCAHKTHPAHVERDFDPVRDLRITVPKADHTGSIVFPSGTGYIPGLEGRLNPKRDTSDRLYLYANNIAIEGGKPQPVPFELGVSFEVEDKDGRVFDLKIVEVIGRSSLIEFTEK